MLQGYIHYDSSMLQGYIHLSMSSVNLLIWLVFQWLPLVDIMASDRHHSHDNRLLVSNQIVTVWEPNVTPT